jgi:toxin ParE1/3/4
MRRGGPRLAVAREVVFAPEARADILDLYDDIAPSAGPERALKYTQGIVVFCRGLVTFPERGTRRDDLRPGLRTIVFRRRVTIAFHITSATVVI